MIFLIPKFHFQDGTIGEDLVIKPAPTTVKQLMKDQELTSAPPSHWSRDWGEQEGAGEGQEAELEDDGPELPVDYAFLGGTPVFISCYRFRFLYA